MVELRHFGIVIKDWKKAKKFYCDILGLKVLKRNTIKGEFLDRILSGYRTLKSGYKFHWVKSLTYIKLIDGKNKVNSLEFYVFPELRNCYTDVCHHIAFTVNDLDKLYLTLQQKHVYCKCEPRKAPDSNVRFMFCTDYEGNLIEIVEEPKCHRAQV